MAQPEITRRICPRHQHVIVSAARQELPLELVPTESELLAADRARNAFKDDQRWFAVSDHNALQLEVQRSRGAL